MTKSDSRFKSVRDRVTAYLNKEMQEQLYSLTPKEMSKRDGIRFCMNKAEDIKAIKTLLLNDSLESDEVLQQISDIVL